MTTTTATTRSWVVPVLGLLIAAFSVCTAEFVISGLLPAVATDLGVDIPTAGLLVSGYALGVGIAGPLLALATGSVPRKLLLLVIMAVFVAGNVLCALSTSYLMLLGARLVIASCHGLFFGVAMVIATKVAPPDRQATALSLIMTGVTVATVIGVPIGTAIGNAFGWRVTFWVIAGAAVVAALVLALLTPATKDEERGASTNSKAEIAAAFRPAVLICYAIFTFGVIPFFVVLTYLVPLLTEVSGVPLDLVPAVLFAIGIAAFFGNLAGGRLGDWNPTATIFGGFSINVVLWVVVWLMAPNGWAVVVLLCVIWLVSFTFPASMQSRLLAEVKDAPTFTATLMNTAIQIGIASAAALGGLVIASGAGYRSLPLLGAAFLALALLCRFGLLVYDRRRKAPQAATGTATEPHDPASATTRPEALGAP